MPTTAARSTRRDSKPGDQSTFGCGANLSTVLIRHGRRAAQARLTYGQGLFRYVNGFQLGLLYSIFD